LSESVTRIFFTYLAQILLAALLFWVFRHFSRVFQRHYLWLWSLSWLAMAVHTLGSAVQMVLPRAPEKAWIIYQVFTMLSQVGIFLHLLLLAFGMYEWLKGVRTRIAQRRLWMLASVLIALVLVIAYARHPEGATMRYVLRVGTRYFLSTLTFTLCAWAIFKFERDYKGIGRKLLAFTFLSWGLVQSLYFTTVMVNVLGGNMPFPFAYFGIFDLMFLGLIGMAMVLWLLEGEHRQLLKANVELDNFLYRTSHDLRSPIASILGLTRLLNLETKDIQALEYNRKIEERVRKLDEVISDILKYTKSSKVSLRREWVDFNQVVEDAFANVAYNEGARDIQLRYKSGLKNQFLTDPYQLALIVNNLVSNAVKYHRLDQEAPFVQVRFKKKKTLVKIVVEDNGQGIAPAYQDRIFDMFFRASEASEGSGLGLFIVKEAVHRLKGTLELHSEVGIGSRFTVNLNEAAL
jgi:signal transduction histidine kinase